MILLLFLTCLAAKYSTSVAYVRAIDSVNEFGIDFLKTVMLHEPTSFFSSASISTAFAMLLAGANGRSEQEILRTFKFDRLDRVVHDRFQEVIHGLRSRNASNSSFELRMANKIIVQTGLSLQRGFLDVLQKMYQSSLNEVDFRQSALVTADINAWVRTQTSGMVDKIFDDPVDPYAKLVMVNAIYFKGTWVTKFDKGDTRKMTFFGTNGNKEVDFMRKKDTVNVHVDSDRNLIMLELPYVGDAAMVIMFPNRGTSLDQLMKLMSANDIDQLTKKVREARATEVELFLPKLKLEAKYDLATYLPLMGLRDIFTGAADLSRIDGHGGLFVSKALHKAVVEVDEEGTKAAAATAVETMYRSAGPDELVVNRPFLFFIRDNASGLNLFTGRVGKL